MQGLVFWLVYPTLWFLSKLPFRLFYMVSDVVFIIVYYIVGYRRKTVKKNLRIAFPEKTPEELKNIERKFFRHMCDMFLEMIKTISISEKELKRRFVFKDLSYLRELERKNKSIIIMCGHYASYEWMLALQLLDLKFEAFGIYKRIRNKHFDRLVRKIRQRFDCTMVPTYRATEKIRTNQEKGILGNYGMIADQSPKLNRARLWMKFMGINVPVFEGSERLARKYDMCVVYLQVEKKDRGFYEATLIPISENAPEEPRHYITKKFFELLEDQIYNAPEYYLWTHKRWKHQHEPIPADAEVYS